MESIDYRIRSFDSVAIFALISLFAGSFFYQVFVGLGFIPAFAGGYFGIACAVLLIPLLWQYSMLYLLRFKIPTFDAIYFVFLMIFALVAVFNSLITRSTDLLFWHLGAISQCLTVYLMFKGLTGSSRALKYYSLSATVGMTLCIFLLMEDGRFSMREISVVSDSIASYQGFAIAYFLTATIAISNIKSQAVRMLAYLVGCYALYVNGARSEFVAFIIFFVIFEICRSKFKLWPIIVIGLLVSAVSASIYTGAVSLPESRVANLSSLGDDNSSNIRDQISSEGIDKIIASPIFGDYGNYEQGYYIHNILSAWQELGLAGFIYFCALVATPIIVLTWRVYIQGDIRPSNAYALSLAIACLILLVFGKYFTYLMVPAALGYYSSIRNSGLPIKTASEPATPH